MNALRWLVVGLTSSLLACAAGPASPVVDAPKSLAPVAVGETPSTPSTRSTLEKLALRVREDVRSAIVFTTKGTASEAAASLRRAGLNVETNDRDFEYVGADPKWRAYDLVVIEQAPSSLAAGHADRLGTSGTPVIATWTGAAAESASGGLELVETKSKRRFLVWRPREWMLDGDDLGARPIPPRGFQLDEGDSAIVAGRPCRLPSGADIIEVSGNRTTRVVLTGAAAAKLANRSSCTDDTVATAAVRGRVRFSRHVGWVSLWFVEVDEVRVDLDARAMRDLSTRHAKVYARAVKHVARDELAAAATSLDEAAKIIDDAHDGLGEIASREARFDRAMARRLREVAARGGDGKSIVDRIASFDGSYGMEEDLTRAAMRLARPKLLRAYRSAKTVEAAEESARLYAYTIERHVEGIPPVYMEMHERFPRLRFDPYRPPPFYAEGEARIAD